MPGSVVEKLLIGLVGDHLEVVPDRQVRHLPKLLRGGHRPRGVPGRVEEEKPGAGSDPGGDVLRPDVESFRFQEGVGHRHTSRHVDLAVVVGPPRIGDQHLVPRLHQPQKAQHDGLAGPGGDHQVPLRIAGQAVLPGQLLRQAPAQLRDARVGGVLRAPLVQGAFARLPDVLRGGEVGLPDAQAQGVGVPGGQGEHGADLRTGGGKAFGTGSHVDTPLSEGDRNPEPTQRPRAGTAGSQTAPGEGSPGAGDHLQDGHRRLGR